MSIAYDSSAGDTVLGAGFSLSGAFSITRCPKSIAIDDEIRSVQYAADDALCLDGQRLVIVAQDGESIEYRTFPDTHVKVVGYTSFPGMEATRAGSFVYGVKEDARQFYAGGMQLQQSLRLDEVQTRADEI